MYYNNNNKLYSIKHRGLRKELKRSASSWWVYAVVLLLFFSTLGLQLWRVSLLINQVKSFGQMKCQPKPKAIQITTTDDKGKWANLHNRKIGKD